MRSEFDCRKYVPAQDSENEEWFRSNNSDKQRKRRTQCYESIAGTPNSCHLFLFCFSFLLCLLLATSPHYREKSLTKQHPRGWNKGRKKNGGQLPNKPAISVQFHSLSLSLPRFFISFHIVRNLVAPRNLYPSFQREAEKINPTAGQDSLRQE